MSPLALVTFVANDAECIECFKDVNHRDGESLFEETGRLDRWFASVCCKLLLVSKSKLALALSALPLRLKTGVISTANTWHQAIGERVASIGVCSR